MISGYAHIKTGVPPEVAKTVKSLRDEIIAKWMNNPTLDTMLRKLDTSKEVHTREVAMPVVDYFIAEMEGMSPMGDCPTMRRVVETFYEKGLEAQDVFLHCTELKNAAVEVLGQSREGSRVLRQVMSVLDHNLYRILEIYSEWIKEQERRISLHNNLMEEHVLLTVTDLSGRITRVTDAFCQLTGYRKEELLGQTHSLIRHPDMTDAVFSGMWRRIGEGKVWRGKIKNYKKDGGEFIAKTEIIPVKDDDGKVIEYLAIRHDVTDRELSWIDSLTQVFNRRKLDSLLDQMLPSQETHALVMVDIDHFKSINDTYGHPEGDRVLKGCARIIRESVRDQDVVCRWGGEEFLVLLPSTEIDRAEEVAERIRKRMQSGELLKERIVTCSIGVTETRPEDDGPSVFARVDGLLYEAKQGGRNRTVARLAS